VNSLEQRLRSGITTSLIVLMLLFGTLLIVVAREMTEGFIASRLQHDSERLLSALTINDQGTQLDSNRLDGIYHRPLSGHYFVISFSDSPTIYSRSLWDSTLEAPTLTAGEERRWQSEGPSAQPLLLYAAGYEKGGMVLTVVVAEDLSPLHQQLLLYSGLLVGLTLLLLLMLLLIQRRTIRRTFLPLQQVGDEVARIDSGELNQLTTEVPQEVRPLVDEINHLLLLMGDRLERSRSMVGNLAHALKGPLMLLLQSSEGDALKATPATREEIRAQVLRLIDMVEHELKRARLVGSGRPGQQFNPTEELPTLIDLLKRIHNDKQIEIEANYPDGAFSYLDRDDMLELIGNLLDNACKWADQRVRCSISSNAETTITIEDDGPGCSTQEIEQLTRRGRRLDEEREGHGLGLSIAKEITQLYSGSILIDRSAELGGLRVTLQFKPRH